MLVPAVDVDQGTRAADVQRVRMTSGYFVEGGGGRDATGKGKGSVWTGLWCESAPQWSKTVSEAVSWSGDCSAGRCR